MFLAKFACLVLISAFLSPSTVYASKSQKLFRAVGAGDLKQVRKSLTRHSWTCVPSIDSGLLNSVYSFDGTPLVLAIKLKNGEMVSHLLNLGADPNYPAHSLDPFPYYEEVPIEDGLSYHWATKSSPLAYALKERLQDAVEHLVHAGANLENIRAGLPALIYATVKWREIVPYLLTLPINVDAVDPIWKRSALSFAAEKGDVENVRALLAKGASVNVHKQYPGTKSVLFYATQSEDLEVIDLLVRAGIEQEEGSIALN